jgi:hypothetical protein
VQTDRIVWVEGAGEEMGDSEPLLEQIATILADALVADYGMEASSTDPEGVDS